MRFPLAVDYNVTSVVIYSHKPVDSFPKYNIYITEIKRWLCSFLGSDKLYWSNKRGKENTAVPHYCIDH